MSSKCRISPELDSDLHDWLVAEAKRQHRSVNGQVAFILQTFRARMENVRRSGVPEIPVGSVVGVQRVEKAVGE